MIELTYQIPNEADRHHPEFVDVSASNVPRVGDRIARDGFEYDVATVLWRSLLCDSALVILNV